MKYLLLLVTLPCFCQQLTTDQQEILRLELQRNKLEKKSLCYNNALGDSILILKKVPHLEKSFYEIREQISDKNIEKEVFGNDTLIVFFEKRYPDITLWEQKHFPGFTIAFSYKNKKVSPLYHPWGFSIPIIRNDKKYALILNTNDDGGTLHIYKNTENIWEYVTGIELFVF